ncbi:hypothetical protein [Clavibacter californiensis]|nr:hypothetical protein [Clavibacter californiensis]
MHEETHGPVLAMDALLRGSLKVTEPLGECLAAEGITMPFASIRLLPGRPSASGDLEVEVSNHMAGGEDIAHVSVPAGFHDLDVRERDSLVLIMWRETLKRLVARRGGDPAAVDRAADAVRRDDYEFQRHGPWKQDRSRSRRMRLVGVLRDEGFLRLRVEVDELRGERSLRLSVEILGGSSYWSFDRAARSPRWTSSTTVEGISVPGIILGDRGSFTFDVVTGAVEVRGGHVDPLPIEPSGPATAIGFRFVEKPDDHIDVMWGSAIYDFDDVPRGVRGGEGTSRGPGGVGCLARVVEDGGRRRGAVRLRLQRREGFLGRAVHGTRAQHQHQAPDGDDPDRGRG